MRWRAVCTGLDMDEVVRCFHGTRTCIHFLYAMAAEPLPAIPAVARQPGTASGSYFRLRPFAAACFVSTTP
eukprot:10084632-Lingulodinium_polyedra.AAC.1